MSVCFLGGGHHPLQYLFYKGNSRTLPCHKTGKKPHFINFLLPTTNVIMACFCTKLVLLRSVLLLSLGTLTAWYSVRAVRKAQQGQVSASMQEKPLDTFRYPAVATCMEYEDDDDDNNKTRAAAGPYRLVTRARMYLQVNETFGCVIH